MTKPNVPQPPPPGRPALSPPGKPAAPPRKAPPPPLNQAPPGPNVAPAPPPRPPLLVAPPRPPAPIATAPVQAVEAAPSAPLTDSALLEQLGFELLESLTPRGSTTRFRVRTREGTERLLTRVNANAPELEQILFLAGARVMQELAARHDILKVYAVYEEHHAFLSDVWTVGNTLDLSALRWKLEQKLDFIAAIGSALEALHEVSLIHGCLCPSNVLLNDDLRPILTEAGSVSIADHMTKADALDHEYKAFAAPEVLKGIVLEACVDVYSLGQLAHFVLLEELPPGDPSPIPKLDELSKIVPDGVVRVLRKATTRAPQTRYKTVSAFLKELGNYKAPGVGLALSGTLSGTLSGAAGLAAQNSLSAGGRSNSGPQRPKAPPQRPRPSANKAVAPTRSKWWLLALLVGIVVAIVLAMILRR